jgi:hypothetical protein
MHPPLQSKPNNLEQLRALHGRILERHKSLTAHNIKLDRTPEEAHFINQQLNAMTSVLDQTINFNQSSAYESIEMLSAIVKASKEAICFSQTK